LDGAATIGIDYYHLRAVGCALVTRATKVMLDHGGHKKPHGVVHLGLGAFHRAHQALVFDALRCQGDQRWGVFGVAMRNPDVVRTLESQGLRYTVQVQSEQGVEWMQPQILVDTAVAATQVETVKQAIAASSTRWITLTVTEKGYTVDLAELIVDGLYLRYAAGLRGVTVASCDNVSNNGTKLLSLCIAYAEQNRFTKVFVEWLASACAFPNSMVDRIVPASTALRVEQAQQKLSVIDNVALATEAFWEWVIEDRFADPSDAETLERGGVKVVADVRPFEQAKLSMLNGSHSAIACIGAVAGFRYVAECINHLPTHEFIRGFMSEEVGPHVRRPDWEDYRESLLARFANPALQHSVHQIATDSSLKIPQRWVPTAQVRVESALSTRRLAFVSAAWIRYLKGVDDKGHRYDLNDPMAAQLQEIVRSNDGDSEQLVAKIGSIESIWGPVLPRRDEWGRAVLHAFKSVEGQGVLAALAAVN
jgi:fructuronate reductase